MTSTTPQQTGNDRPTGPASTVRELLGRITRLEIGAAAVIGAVLLLLVAIEPGIVEAPFENEQSLLFTVGGTALAAVAFAAMLWLRVPAPVRLVVLLVPFAIVNWWLLSPFFIDDVVDDEFSTSISAQAAEVDTPSEAPADPVTVDDGTTSDAEATTEADAATDDATAADADPAPAAEAAPDTPVLLGAGSFVGLTGHSGSGDAGIFRNPDGSFVLRFENFETDNGPDLDVYLVPGADQTEPGEGSIDLGALRGNIGDQTYELPPGTELPPGPYTALVWCEAFSVEFTAATVNL